MNEENRELLSEVIKANLIRTLDATQGSDEEKTAFKQAMEAISRQADVSKNDDSYQEHADELSVEKDKLELEKQKIEIEKAKLEAEKRNRANDEEFKKAEAKKALILKGVEIGAMFILTPIIDGVIKKSFAKVCMLWEDDHTFTTEPGKSVRNFFKFKR